MRLIGIMEMYVNRKSLLHTLFLRVGKGNREPDSSWSLL